MSTVLTFSAVRCGIIEFLILLTCTTSNQDALSKYENKFVYSIVAVQGMVAKLPCDITPSFSNDKVDIVIWYKENQNGKHTPIYSFDSRDNILLEQGKHWSDELILGGRAHFRFQDEPAKLIIDSVLHNDAGVYQCRVDFKRSPTRSSKVNLTVIIPPEKIIALNERGIQVDNYILGPYNEGSPFNITCISTGGMPSPKVTWWQENALLDGSCEKLSDNRVRNVLHIERLQRKHLYIVLTCQASNNDRIAPISISKSLELNLPPLSVRLLGENKHFSIGITYQLRCEIVGARPIPNISWWKGGILIKDTQETKSFDGNVTISTLNFMPSLDDEGKYIFCVAEQPFITGGIVESERRKLHIRHIPVISLELDNKFNNTVIEGSDVHFKCNIKSNPWVYKVRWKHNEKVLLYNVSEGIIINNQSLVLQSVSKDRAGFYTCIGSNQEGDGESNAVRLDINFTPVCRSKGFVRYNLPLYQTVRISCEVEASPANFMFTWMFNNTNKTPDMISLGQTTSTISYTPATEQDYGTLFCWAANSVGEQQEPCVFHIAFADKPDPVSNCSLLNQTHQSLLVKCALSLNGGVKQTFVAEVYDFQTRRLLKNLSSEFPIFSIDGLSPGLKIEIYLYVLNKNGKSEAQRLKALFPKLEENRIDVLLPPENCSVTSHTRYKLRIKCQVPEAQRCKSLTYLLHVYNANSLTLVTTSISQSPEAITATTPLTDHQDLVLFIRGIDENSVISEAAIFYVPAFAKTSSSIHHASAPMKFYITPKLTITICGVLSVILVVGAILLACRLCGKNKRNHREYNDGGLPSIVSHCTVAVAKDNSPINRNDSESRNPDIIPLKSNKVRQEEESVIELLQTAPSTTYMKLDNPDDINVRYLVNSQFLKHQHTPVCTNRKLTTTALPDYEPKCLLNTAFSPTSLQNHSSNFGIYTSEVSVGTPSPLPKESVFLQENSEVLQPLLVDRSATPVIALSKDRFRVTQI